VTIQITFVKKTVVYYSPANSWHNFFFECLPTVNILISGENFFLSHFPRLSLNPISVPII